MFIWFYRPNLSVQKILHLCLLRCPPAPHTSGVSPSYHHGGNTTGGQQTLMCCDCGGWWGTWWEVGPVVLGQHYWPPLTPMPRCGCSTAARCNAAPHAQKVTVVADCGCGGSLARGRSAATSPTSKGALCSSLPGSTIRLEMMTRGFPPIRAISEAERSEFT